LLRSEAVEAFREKASGVFEQRLLVAFEVLVA
jgi:hypothetical protein